MTLKPGDKIAEKLPTDELKKSAYESYCAHIAKGYPQKAWCFQEGPVKLTWETMEAYIKRYPELAQPGGILDPIHKAYARCENYMKWFKVVEGSALGENPEANTASLQMIMRNIHLWDVKDESKRETQGETDTRKVLYYIEEGVLTPIKMPDSPPESHLENQQLR